MKIIRKDKLKAYQLHYPEASSHLGAWVLEVEDQQWKTPHDIKQHYPTASILKAKKVIFNIRGNSYRLLTLVDYQYGFVIIENFGTHSEYDKWKIE